MPPATRADGQGILPRSMTWNSLDARFAAYRNCPLGASTISCGSAWPGTYLDSALFQPLGMRMTAFHATPAMEGRITTAYARGGDGKLHPTPQLLSPEYTEWGKLFSGGGGLLSTIGDYLRFAQIGFNGAARARARKGDSGLSLR